MSACLSVQRFNIMNRRTIPINYRLLRSNNPKRILREKYHLRVSLLVNLRGSIRVLILLVIDLIIVILNTNKIINMDLIVVIIVTIAVVGMVVDLSIENMIIIGTNNIQITTIILIILIIT